MRSLGVSMNQQLKVYVEVEKGDLGEVNQSYGVNGACLFLK